MNDRDAAPAEGAGDMETAYREWASSPLGYGRFEEANDPRIPFEHGWRSALGHVAARPAAPTPEEAEAACAARLDVWGYIGLHTRAIFRDGWMDALAWRAARPAPSAAGGEAFTEAEVRAYAENLLASGPHAASGRDILAMVRFLTTAHRQAARAAARGDAPEGTHHRPVVDAAGHELVGDGTP